MNGHTAGKWAAPFSEASDAVQIAIMYGGEYGQHIATVHGPGAGATKDTMRANALLIAAAPELLEALKACQVRIMMLEGNQGDTYQQAAAAIAKAQGGGK